MFVNIKRFDWLVSRSFIVPYILSFLIALFVLVMQFLWKYIDDITGKGISLFEIMELVFYFSLTIIPLAIPISILLSSVFVFGNMAEKFELTSMKSAGISLIRIFRPGLYLAVVTALFSILASNVIVPKANELFFLRFDAIRKLKPALSIEEGLFNDDFYGYKIFVKEKHVDEKTVEDVLIYNESTLDYDLINVIFAERGYMETSPDGRYFIMNLYNGEQIRELRSSRGIRDDEDTDKYPLTRTHFEQWQKVFDMGEFDIHNISVNLNRRKYDLMNTVQLLAAIDSVEQYQRETTLSSIYQFNEIVDVGKKRDQEEPEVQTTELPVKRANRSKPGSPTVSISRIYPKQKGTEDLKAATDLLQTFSEEEQPDLIVSAHTMAQKVYSHSSDMYRRFFESNLQKARFVLKLNQQYSWATVCIIFLFIGGPMGSIIRRGGYGYPLLLAIFFFMVFIILRIMGEKLWRSQLMDPVVAAWLPCMVLAPIAAFLTYKALTDSKMFVLETYMLKFGWWRKLTGISK